MSHASNFSAHGTSYYDKQHSSRDSGWHEIAVSSSLRHEIVNGMGLWRGNVIVKDANDAKRRSEQKFAAGENTHLISIGF